MDRFIQDLRYGARQLYRQRGSSLVTVVTLALGIGATTAVRYAHSTATRNGCRRSSRWRRATRTTRR